jgi:selenocysteine-specific elongation factor
MKGFGTVVTGTILGGRVRVGDDVVTLPSGKAAKVRGLQVHGEAVEEARAGMRCAVNLGGVERHEVERGSLLAHADTIEPSHLVDARLTYLKTSKTPLGRRARALVHHATSYVMAQVVLVDRDELAPGDDAIVQLHLETPIAALPGDRFILRGFVPQAHYGTTIGGGEVVRVHAPKVRRSQAEAAEHIKELAAAAPSERVGLEVAAAGPAGMSKKTLHARLGLAPQAIDAALGRLVDARELAVAGELYAHAETMARLEQQTLAAIDAFHEAAPHKEGIPREELRTKLSRSLPPRLFELLLGDLVRRSAIALDKEVVRRAKRAAAAAPLADRVCESLKQMGLETPAPKDIPAALKEPDADVRAALDVLLRAGRLVRVRPDYYVEKSVLDGLREKLRAFLVEHKQITAQEFKAMTNATRKYAIPLAEHFDAEKLTLRVGEIRKLRG